MKVYGQLERAQIENVGALPAAGTKGRVVFLTTDNRFYIDNGSAWEVEVTPSSTDTLTNKTLTAPTMSNPSISSGPITIPEQTTPATPSSGFGKIYFKSDGFLYQLNDDGTETKVGSGSGGINYISSNPDAESSTTGWATYKDAAQSTPVDGTGGSPTLTFTRTTSSPLRGTASFLITTTAANLQGEGASFDFTIASADQAKVMSISFDYQIASGTYADGDMTVYIYDVTNAQVIQPAGYSILNISSTVGKQIATFQTASNSTSYRLIFHRAVSTASAMTMKIDNVQLGPQVVQYGAPMTDPVSYTPVFTGFGTVSSVNVKSWREGAFLVIDGTFTSGTTTATEARMSLGFNGVEGNVTSVSTLPTLSICGFMNGGSTSATNFGGSNVAIEASKSYVTFVINNSTNSMAKSNGNAFASTSTYSFQARVPITGWSSTVQMSNDTDTRVVATNMYRSGTQTGVNPNGSRVKVNLNAIANDTHGTADTSGFKWTAPVSGWYTVAGGINVQATNVLANRYSANILKGGSTVVLSGQEISLTAGVAFNLTVAGSIYLNAGEYLELYLYGAGNNSASTLTVDQGSGYTFLSAVRASGPSAIAASESVYARYTASGATSVTNGGTTIIDFASKDFDSHGSVTTGASWKFTAPVSGVFNVSASVAMSNASWTAGNDWSINVYKNGSNHQRIFYYVEQATFANAQPSGSGSTLVRLNAGDYVDIRCTNTGTTANTLTGTNVGISIHRIGN
jgi:hypothetical protein